MDHRDPCIEGNKRRRQLDGFALQWDLSRVRLIDAGNDLHQGRFAGTILAHQRVDGARTNLESDAIQRHDAWKLLAHSLHLQEIRHMWQYSGDLAFIEGLLEAQRL